MDVLELHNKMAKMSVKEIVSILYFLTLEPQSEINKKKFTLLNEYLKIAMHKEGYKL